MAPPYTNQHYVPESYLQGWTYEGEDCLSIFLIEQEHEVNWQPIDEICSAKNFNSEYKPLEILLGRLESAHANAFNRIRNGYSLRSLPVGERRLLLSFAVTQRMRSKLMREEIESLGESLVDKVLEEDVPKLGLDTEEFRKMWESRSDNEIMINHHAQMMQGILAPFGMHELEAVVLDNTSQEPFVTSEAPIIFENPRFKQERGMNYPGMSNGGLQIYCPISPTQCLLFYDPEIYGVARDKGAHAELSDPQEVRELNMLQVLATDSFLIYQGTEQVGRIISLIKDARQYEDWEPVELSYDSIVEYSEPGSYSYVPQHQLHSLIPSLSPVIQYTGTAYRQRKDAETVQRYLIHRILSQVESSERAVISAIVFMMKNAGIDLREISASL